MTGVVVMTDSGRTYDYPAAVLLQIHEEAIDEYVRAAQGAGLREIRLIHGRGAGVQRGIVQQALEKHPLVAEFFDAPESHLGATVAILKTKG